MSAINREDAIKALEDVGAMFPYRIPGIAETYRPYNEAWNDAIDKAEQAIEALPDAEDGWIPCSERLPKDDTEVFVYLFDRQSPYIAWLTDCHWYTEDFEVDKENEPLAWMPLPPAYKPKEDTQ